MAKVLSYSEGWVRRIIPFIAFDKGVDLSFYRTCELQHLTAGSTTTESTTAESTTSENAITESATAESATDGIATDEDIWKIPSKKPNSADLLIFITQTFSGMPNFTFKLAGEN